MAGKKNTGENSKKAAGQARKAEAAAGKQAAKDREVAAKEDAEWAKGSKDNGKKQAAADKAAEAARKKAEKDALLKAEEDSMPSKPKGGKAPKAEKKTRGTLDLGQLDEPARPSTTLNASGIDNALDALSLTGASNDKVDRHPERRYKAAYTAYETKRLEEMADEKGLRRNQKIEQIRKEFEKHPDNPFNQVAGKYNSTREELREIGEAERRKMEDRLASP